MKGDRLAVAFLGAGTVAEMHGRALRAHGQADFAGVFDPNGDHAKNIVARFGGRVYRTETELLEDPAVAAIYVLTPVAQHPRQAAAALTAGKHVLVEKPVAMNQEEITELAQLAAQQRRVCMPGHNYIYVPALARGRRIVAAGKLGEIASLWIFYNVHHPEALVLHYGGVLRAVCIHHIYSLFYLLGRPVAVSATGRRLKGRDLPVEDQVMLTCTMPDGGLANLWASFATNDAAGRPWSVLYKVLGTRGGFCYDWSEASFDDNGGPAWGLPCYEDGFIGETVHFLDRCIGSGEAPLSTLADARDALCVIEAAERSIRTQRIESIIY